MSAKTGGDHYRRERREPSRVVAARLNDQEMGHLEYIQHSLMSEAEDPLTVSQADALRAAVVGYARYLDREDNS